MTIKTRKLIHFLIKNILLSYFLLFVLFICIFLYFTNKVKILDDVLHSTHNIADLQLIEQGLLTEYARNPNKDNLLEFIQFKDQYLETIAEYKQGMLKNVTKAEANLLNKYFDLKKNFFKQMNGVYLADIKNISNSQEQSEELYIDSIKLVNVFEKNKVETLERVITFSLVVIGIVFILSLIYVSRNIKYITELVEVVIKLSQNFSLLESKQSEKLDTDIEEFLTLKNSLVEMRKRIFLQNRLEKNNSAAHTVSELSENLAHSINNPLAIMATSAKIIKKKAAKIENDYIVSEATAITEEINRVSSITNRMKKLIQSSDKAEFTEFPIINLLTVVDLYYLSRFFENRISFKYDQEIETKKMYGVEFSVTQIVLSLVSNSVETLAHVKKNMESVEDKPDLSWIEVEVTENDKDCILRVTDSGDLADQALIRDCLDNENDEQTEHLGLRTSRTLAREMGGDLYYYHAPHTCFELRVPKNQEKSVG